jgi:predicted transcriptional regulator
MQSVSFYAGAAVLGTAAALIGSRALAGGAGLCAKGASQAANYAGYNDLGQNLDKSGDSLISFATRELSSTELKISGAIALGAFGINALVNPSCGTCSGNFICSAINDPKVNPDIKWFVEPTRTPTQNALHFLFTQIPPLHILALIGC